MSKPTVAVVGASDDRRKFGNKSVRAHLKQGYDVYPVHPTSDVIEGLKVYRTLQDVPVEHLDRITIYLPPHIGLTFLEEIQKKGAEKVWFNPGSESPEIIQRTEELGLEIIIACSVVNIGADPGDFDA